MNPSLRSLFFWTVIIVLIALLWQSIQGGREDLPWLTFSEFLTSVDDGLVASVTLRGDEIIGDYKTGERFGTLAPDYPDLVNVLRAAGVEIQAEVQKEDPIVTMLFAWGPVLLIVGLWMFFMRKAKGHANMNAPLAINHSHQVGIQQGQVELLERQLVRRFGEIPDAVADRLRNGGADDLQRWSERILDANRIEDVFDP